MGHCWGSKEELFRDILSWTCQFWLTISVWTQNANKKTYQEQWMKGMDHERESANSLLSMWLDDAYFEQVNFGFYYLLKGVGTVEFWFKKKNVHNKITKMSLQHYSTWSYIFFFVILIITFWWWYHPVFFWCQLSSVITKMSISVHDNSLSQKLRQKSFYLSNHKDMPTMWFLLIHSLLPSLSVITYLQMSQNKEWKLGLYCYLLKPRIANISLKWIVNLSCRSHSYWSRYEHFSTIEQRYINSSHRKTPKKMNSLSKNNSIIFTWIPSPISNENEGADKAEKRSTLKTYPSQKFTDLKPTINKFIQQIPKIMR